MTSFFDEPLEQSLVKAQIVASYFAAWSSIMARRAERIGYFDFYAGPGRYSSGDKSTPLLIVERAIADAKLRDRLVCLFNDANPDYASNLAAELEALPGYSTLRFPPDVRTGEVSDDLVDEFEKISMIPALSFIDPWGYKGLSLRLIKAVVKDWGCEAIFFFNYNRINMGVNNVFVDTHMRALFGHERLTALQIELNGAGPEMRERLICRALGDALTDAGAPYLIPFRFARDGGRVSHYICFVSKHRLGYEIMKDIMASHGVVDIDGVPQFEYLPEAEGRQIAFAIDRPLAALAPDLLRKFAGRTLTMGAVFHQHNVGTPFVSRNYKSVLGEMESRGEIACDPRAENRRRGTFANNVRVTFPRVR